MGDEGKDYDYKPRETVPMPEQSFRLGDGKIKRLPRTWVGQLMYPFR